MAELSRASEADPRRTRLVNLASGHLSGELDRELRQVAVDSWQNGHFSYLAGPGLDALRDAVLDWLEMGHVRRSQDVLVSPGSRAALTAVLSVVSGPGEVVLIDAAAWSIFHQLVAVVGATPVPCRPGAGAESRWFKLSAADVRAHLELLPGARALVIANPVNNTGQLYTAAELSAIVEECAAHGVFCVIDRVYGRLVFDGARFPWLDGSPAVRDWCVLVDGLARAVRGAGGLRVGWACGPRDIIEAAATAQEHGPGPAGRVEQRVALAALRAPFDLSLVEELQTARDLFVEQVAQLPDARVWPIPATMHGIVDLSPWLGSTTPVGWIIDSSSDLADYLLATEDVLVTPSDLFGAPGTVRLSFSAPWELIAEGIGRIGDALGRLRRPR